MMRKVFLLIFVVLFLMLAGCSGPVKVIEYPPLDWSINGQRLAETGCVGNLQESCPELTALGCDEIKAAGFYLGGLRPPYPVVECIHQKGEPPDKAHFKQQSGLDGRYRSFAVNQGGKYRLIIRKSEFKEIFAPVETTDEAISYAMAMTSLGARFDIDPRAKIDYLVDVIEETHAEKTPEGYLVSLFDWSHKMGCDIHPFYAVKVLVTPEGDVHEAERQVIYKSYACFDFEKLALDED